MSQSLNNFASIKLVTGYINTENVASPGLPAASPSGSIWQPYGGFVGVSFHLTTAEALALSNTTIGTCYEGEYMYVATDSTAAGTIARGTVVFWADRSASKVTPDVGATTVSQMAGIALCTVTNGNYCIIQISGRASVKFRAAVTKVAPAVGDLVLMDATPTNTADVILDATAITSPLAKLVLGVAVGAAPASATISQVVLRFVGLNN
jgi:hypothetical protein